MTVTISKELEVQVRNKAKAEGVSVESYVESLIREDEEWREQSEEPLEASDPEFAHVQAAVTRGEGRVAEEVFAELRAINGIPRSTVGGQGGNAPFVRGSEF